MGDVRVQRFGEGVEVDVVHAVLFADLLDDRGYRGVVVLRGGRSKRNTARCRKDQTKIMGKWGRLEWMSA